MKIRNVVKGILGISMVGIIVLGMSACQNKKDKESTLNKDTLILGFDDTFVPMGFKDDNGDYSGFDIELAKAVADKLGKNLEFQPIDWTMKESELNNGNIDMIWNGYSVTDERKEKVDFSKSYLKNRQIIITLKNSDIKTKEEFQEDIYFNSPIVDFAKTDEALRIRTRWIKCN